MKTTLPSVLCLAALLAAAPADAAGLLLPTDGSPPLSIEEHAVAVEIIDGLAVTEVTQVFRNGDADPREAVYSFPLPHGASLAGFSMWIDGREMAGEVLPRGEAREVYEDIVREEVAPTAEEWRGKQIIDPGLVEQVSYREFRVTIFPVPARGTQKVRLTYHEHLPVVRDTVRYTYPLETRAIEDSRVSTDLAIRFELHSAVPLSDYWLAQDHENAVLEDEASSHRLRVTLQERDGSLDEDFVVTWRLAREEAGIDVIPFRALGEDGVVMILASAPVEDDSKERGRVDYTFVVDVSGSMRLKRRLDVAARAVAGFLEGAGDRDRFNVIAFNVAPVLMSPDSLANDGASRAKLQRFLGGFRGVGATDLFPALRLALDGADPSREHAVVVITDGGLNDLDEEHARFLDLVAGEDVTVFGLAIGNDANLPLLSALAGATGGFTAQVSSREDLRRRGNALRDRMRRSPWRDLELEVSGGARLTDLAPGALPDLYPGGQVALFARYHGSGDTTFRLRGVRDGREVSLATTAELPAEDGLYPEIRRAWARARVEALVQGIRSGELAEESVAIVERLGVTHSIVTPFTSFLVLETDEMFDERGIPRRSHALLEEERRARQERVVRASADVREVGAGPPARRSANLGLGAFDPAACGLLVLVALSWLGVMRRSR